MDPTRPEPSAEPPVKPPPGNMDNEQPEQSYEEDIPSDDNAEADGKTPGK